MTQSIDMIMKSPLNTLCEKLEAFCKGGVYVDSFTHNGIHRCQRVFNMLEFTINKDANYLRGGSEEFSEVMKVVRILFDNGLIGRDGRSLISDVLYSLRFSSKYDSHTRMYEQHKYERLRSCVMMLAKMGGDINHNDFPYIVACDLVNRTKCVDEYILYRVLLDVGANVPAPERLLMESGLDDDELLSMLVSLTQGSRIQTTKPGMVAQIGMVVEGTRDAPASPGSAYVPHSGVAKGVPLVPQKVIADVTPMKYTSTLVSIPDAAPLKPTSTKDMALATDLPLILSSPFGEILPKLQRFFDSDIIGIITPCVIHNIMGEGLNRLPELLSIIDILGKNECLGDRKFLFEKIDGGMPVHGYSPSSSYQDNGEKKYIGLFRHLVKMGANINLVFSTTRCPNLHMSMFGRNYHITIALIESGINIYHKLSATQRDGRVDVNCLGEYEGHKGPIVVNYVDTMRKVLSFNSHSDRNTKGIVDCLDRADELYQSEMIKMIASSRW